MVIRLDEFERVNRRTDYILKRLKDLIELGRSTFYQPQYQANISDQEVLGVIVAKFCKWTGDQIVKTFLEALEDANYHTLSAQVEELYNGHLKEVKEEAAYRGIDLTKQDGA